jgi:hypothetical protein
VEADGTAVEASLGYADTAACLFVGQVNPGKMNRTVTSVPAKQLGTSQTMH